MFLGKKTGFGFLTKKSAGCGISVKKERECGIKIPPSRPSSSSRFPVHRPHPSYENELVFASAKYRRVLIKHTMYLQKTHSIVHI